jgi:hypothetical protein
MAAIAIASLGHPLTAVTLRYWVDSCTRPETGCRNSDPELAEWALAAWQAASDGKLAFAKAADAASARIRIHWVSGRDGLYGEAVGGDVYVRPEPGEGLLRESITYLTCLHETGHALGLSHTADFADIMYSFQFGGDIAEYFGRYRRKLTRREDIRKHPGMSSEDKRRLIELLLSDRGDHRPRGLPSKPQAAVRNVINIANGAVKSG